MRITTIAGTVALALAATALTACGSHDGPAASSAYCRALETDKAYFQSLDGDHPDLSRLDDMFARLHSLAADAPAGVAGDWQTVDDAVTTIEGALADAGLEPDDLALMQEGQVPEGADLDEIAALTPALQALGGAKVNGAADQIARDARATCGIDLQAS